MLSLSGRVLERAKEAAIIKKFLLYSHPTTNLFVDDEKRVLDMLQAEFSDAYLCKFFDDSMLASDFIKSYQYPNPESLIQKDENSNIQHFNLFKLHQAIYDAQRFTLLGVLCSDQEMQKLDGMELCRGISNLPIYRFLFTGKATIREYVLDIQNGIIDGFIHKNRPDAMQHVHRLLQDFQKLFFSRLHANFILQFVKTKGLNHYLFCDQFMDLVTQFYRGNGAIERYLLDDSGSHLFLTSKGETSVIIIRNKLDIYAALKHNKNAKEKAPASVIKLIQSGKKILYTGTDNDLSISPARWKEYLIDADAFMIGDKKIYYATISGKVPGIDASRIVSYETYAKQQTK